MIPFTTDDNYHKFSLSLKVTIIINSRGWEVANKLWGFLRNDKHKIRYASTKKLVGRSEKFRKRIKMEKKNSRKKEKRIQFEILRWRSFDENYGHNDRPKMTSRVKPSFSEKNRVNVTYVYAVKPFCALFLPSCAPDVLLRPFPSCRPDALTRSLPDASMMSCLTTCQLRPRLSACNVWTTSSST